MKKIVVLAFLLIFGTSACVSTKAPKRPSYEGEDKVATVDKSLIIGKWQTRILNPIEGEESANGAVVHYNDDGSVILDSQFDTGGMGMMEMEVTGTWAIEGDLIKQVATDVREKSGNALGTFVKIFKGRMLKSANATLDVYEATADRLVIVSDHGQAQELTRIE